MKSFQQLSDQEIDEIFTDKETDDWQVIIIPILVFIAIILLLIIPLFANKILSIKADSNAIQTYLYFAAGGILSILCGFVANYVTKKWDQKLNSLSENRKIQNLKSICDPDLTKQFIHDINHFNGIYYKEYKIHAFLLKAGALPLFKCRVEYSYWKFVKGNHLNFKIIRIRNEQEADEDRHKNHHLENEYFFRSDERSFGNISVDGNFYKIYNLRIDSQNIKLNSHVANNHLNFSHTLEPAKLNKEVFIEFTVEYFFEKDSFTYMMLDFPALGVQCEFDFSQVKDDIDFYSYSFSNSQNGLGELHSKGADSHLYRQYKDWFLPQSNFFFIWYDKHKKSGNKQRRTV